MKKFHRRNGNVCKAMISMPTKSRKCDQESEREGERVGKMFPVAFLPKTRSVPTPTFHPLVLINCLIGTRNKYFKAKN